MIGFGVDGLEEDKLSGARATRWRRYLGLEAKIVTTSGAIDGLEKPDRGSDVVRHSPKRGSRPSGLESVEQRISYTSQSREQKQSLCRRTIKGGVSSKCDEYSKPTKACRKEL